MQSDIKPSRCTAKKQFAKGEQRNIIDSLKASVTTDSIKIFSITFCTLVTVYCTYKIAKDAFIIVLYATTFYMQHCAVACFVLRANGESQEAPAHTLPVVTRIDTLKTGWTPIFITQRYTLYHAFQDLCEFIGHIFEKNGEISATEKS